MSETPGLRFSQVDLGDDLPDHRPDVSLDTVRRFATKAAYMPAPRRAHR